VGRDREVDPHAVIVGAPIALVDCNNFYASCERMFGVSTRFARNCTLTGGLVRAARKRTAARIAKRNSAARRRFTAAAPVLPPSRPPADTPSGDALDTFRKRRAGNDPYEVISKFQDEWRAEGYAVIRSPEGTLRLWRTARGGELLDQLLDAAASLRP
jgi:hypothetical protein